MTAAESDAVTVVEGTTFCRSDRTGDVVPGTTQGLFVRDTRVLSRWELRLDGEPPHPLAVHGPDAYAARFVLRRAPAPGLADSTLLVVRDRTVGDGLQETVTLTNLGTEPAELTVALHVGADFADLFAVKESRPVAATATAEVRSDVLVLTAPDSTRGLELRASAEPLVTTGTLVWRTVVAPRSSWTATVHARPTAAAAPDTVRLSGDGPTDPRLRQLDWRRTSSRIEVDDPVLRQVLRRTDADLGALRIDSGTGHTFIAAGAPWFMTLFGRDSLLTGWMALPLHPGLALGTLETLARLQGTEVDPRTEEEPGRILHELRLGPDSSGSPYYGSVDATPLFVMLLAEALRWGADPDRVRALLPAADAALTWVGEYGDRDGDGFVEYQSTSHGGLANQGWKDSFDAISDRAGRFAEPPIALCEVQGYVYAAYLARAYLAETLEDDTVLAARWRTAAAGLFAEFQDRFWLPDLGWYALGLDAAKQPIDALSSNAAHALWTGIASDAGAEAMIPRLADLDSGYGLRTLAADMGRYNPMSYHNGSVWPHDTALAVAGLLRYPHVPGAVDLAYRLAEGLVDAAGEFDGRLPELFCGFGRTEFSPPVPYPTSCSPQAWAAAAPLLLVRAFLGLDPDVPARRLDLAPRIPPRWGRVNVVRMRLGRDVVQVTAGPEGASATGLPAGWTVRAHRPSVTRSAS